MLTPLIAFEFRHNFQQVRGLVNINNAVEGEGREIREGYYKVEVVAEYANRVIWSPFLFQANPKNPMIAKIPIFLFVFFGLIFFLFKRKFIDKNELFLLYLWIFIVIFGQLISKRLISDYYFNNLLIISLIVFSLFISHLSKGNLSKKVLLIFACLFLLFGFKEVVTEEMLFKEFEDRREVVEYIAKDAKEKNFPCVSINYIGEIPVRYGYRYLFWWKGVAQITPGNDIPVYSIVQPYTISKDEVVMTSGNIGVILPSNDQIPDESLCTKPERQLLPLNGFLN